VALAARFEQSLQQDEQLLAVSAERQEALQHLIGIWKTEQPPNEEQVQRILEFHPRRIVYHDPFGKSRTARRSLATTYYPVGDW
jgi:hypothetical protein